MNEIHIDTNIYSHALRGDPEAVAIFQSANRIFVSPVVLGELLSGFKWGNRKLQNKRQLDEFLDSPRVRLFGIGEDTAEHYSQIYVNLKRAGKPIPSNDMWIAACAMEHGKPLATYDEHFRSVTGLLLKDLSQL